MTYTSDHVSSMQCIDIWCCWNGYFLRFMAHMQGQKSLFRISILVLECIIRVFIEPLRINIGILCIKTKIEFGIIFQKTEDVMYVFEMALTGCCLQIIQIICLPLLSLLPTIEFWWVLGILWFHIDWVYPWHLTRDDILEPLGYCLVR